MEKLVKLNADGLKDVAETIQGCSALLGTVAGAAAGYACVEVGGGVAGAVLGAAIGGGIGTKLKNNIINKVNEAKYTQRLKEREVKKTMESYGDMFMELNPQLSGNDKVLLTLLSMELAGAARENRRVDTTLLLQNICAQNKCDFETMNAHIERGLAKRSNIKTADNVTVEIERVNMALEEHQRELRFVLPAQIQEKVKESRDACEMKRVEDEERSRYEAMVSSY